MKVEAGNDLLQHPDQTGGTPIPDELMEQIVARQLPCMALLVTERYLDWLRDAKPEVAAKRMVADENNRAFIAKGARVLLTTDAFAYGQRVKQHAGFRPDILEDDVPDMPTQIGRAHFLWIRAASERGMEPIEILRAATDYPAQAYGKSHLYGTVVPGKAGDLVVLDADPLAAPENYGRIREVVKDGWSSTARRSARTCCWATTRGVRAGELIIPAPTATPVGGDGAGDVLSCRAPRAPRPTSAPPTARSG